MRKPTNLEVFDAGEPLYDYVDDLGNWVVYGYDDEQYHVLLDSHWAKPYHGDEPALTFADLGGPDL